MPNKRQNRVAMRLTGQLQGKSVLEFDEGDVKAVADIVALRLPIKEVAKRLITNEAFMTVAAAALIQALEDPQLGARIAGALRQHTDLGDTPV